MFYFSRVPGRLSVFPALVLLSAAFALPVRAQTLLPATSRLAASDGVSGDQFGISVALSGTTALVGANSKDVGTNSFQGAAYLFNLAAGTQTRLTASDGAASDQFGVSVALGGGLALVGANQAAINGNNQQGAAYLFNATTGAQTRKLTASDGVTGDLFGSAVALSGSTALIGAAGDSAGNNSFESQGSVYVFSTATGQQSAKLTASDGAAGDQFGIAVALSGTTALIGANLDTVGGNVNQGSAYLFTTAGQQIAKLTASDGAADSFFGGAVALSGNFALVGAAGSNSSQGVAYLFNIATQQQLFRFTASDAASGAQFGSSVAVSGNFALVGARNADIGASTQQGAVYAFDLTTGQQIAEYSSADGQPFDFFGSSVTLDGTNGLAGAVNGDAINPDQGTAYRLVIVSAAVLPEPDTLGFFAVALATLPLVRRRACRQSA